MFVHPRELRTRGRARPDGPRRAFTKQLRDAGVAIFKGPESHENGKFLWLLDPDGNKLELWEPKLWDSKNKDA